MQLLTGNVPRRIVCIFLLSVGWPVQFSVVGTSRDTSRSLHVGSPVYEQRSNEPSAPRRIIKVPSDFTTIAQAVDKAVNGDWIIISPGTYYEKEIVINKSVTVSSEWKTTGEESVIDETIIDAGDKTLFTITADSVEISGLHMKNGDHTLNILADVSIRKNHFVNNLDAMSFEGPGGGYVGYNFVENDRDDGLDLDIGADKENPGSNITVEHNTIVNSNDDGIEIRLFAEPGQNIRYVIRNNTIMGSKNAGIQLISYDVFTGKEFLIHHNIISDCKTGLGCMEGSKTREDLSGASRMDERVFFFNNTLSGNQMGATGGNQIIAINNLVENNALGGFKNFGANSAIVNNLFYRNGQDNFIRIHESIRREGNIFSLDPLLDKTTFVPAANSPCVDTGNRGHDLSGNFGQISSEAASVLTSDIGARSHNTDKNTLSKKTMTVEAGDDAVLQAPANEVTMSGRIIGDPGSDNNTYWKVEDGSASVRILNPTDLKTKVVFDREGIYRFTLTGSAGNLFFSDSKTIRYTHSGGGRTLFLSEETNIIRAQEYAYLYGNVSVVKGPSPEDQIIQTGMSNGDGRSFAEYFVGTSENADWMLWLRVKKQGREKSIFHVSFNQKKGQSLSIPNKREWQWIRVPGTITVTAGEWPLWIENKGGSLLIDKFVITRDLKFIPE
jgi:hypothetical protein